MAVSSAHWHRLNSTFTGATRSEASAVAHPISRATMRVSGSAV